MIKVLAWLSVRSELKMICTWSSCCYCHSIVSCFIKSLLLIHCCLMYDSLFLWLDVWQSLLTVLRKDQFSSVTFNQQVSFPVWTKHADVSNTSVVTHCFFRHSSGHVVHVVVFYQRGDEQFLWHSSLPDVQHLGLKTASIQFGRHESAYSR